jgi:hypothetical protein
LFLSRFGSVFDAKCDLLVLPCNSRGGVSVTVRKELLNYGMPFPSKTLGWAKCEFVPTNANYPKADFLVFAAAVDAADNESDLQAVGECLDSVVEFAVKNDCTRVNLPPLGTGAGGIAIEDLTMFYRHRLTHLEGTFTLFLPPSRASASRPSLVETTAEPQHNTAPLRVFISYARKNPVVAAWTRELALRLRALGIDARLDVFHLRPGMDLPQWMTNELLKAEKVLIVCDDVLAQKADLRLAGVGWETMLIQGDLLTQGTLSTKYIPISFDDSDRVIPQYLKSRLFLCRSEVDRDHMALLDALKHLPSKD